MANTYLDTNKKLWNEYKVWLMRHELRMPAEKCRMYDDLITFLHNYDFFPPTEKDTARSEDGLELRTIFLEDTNNYKALFHHNPKVLEVLVALAERMDMEYVGDPNNPDPYIIFMEDILDGLGRNKRNLQDNVEDWLDGNRPLFITKNKPSKYDIWSQMQMYIHENYS